MELTVHQSTQPSPMVQRYVLMSVRHELVDVTATRSGEAENGVVEALEAQWRPFRDEAKEQELINRIVARMRRLEAGGGVAP